MQRQAEIVESHYKEHTVRISGCIVNKASLYAYKIYIVSKNYCYKEQI